MRKILFYGSYPIEGYKGLLAEEGSLEAFYYSMGDKDFYIIVNLPNEIKATAVTLAGNACGTFSIRAVNLLTSEEMDRAVCTIVDFRPPGR